MEFLQRACTLNNDGVRNLIAGDVTNGMISFQHALSSMKQASFEADQMVEQDEGCSDVEEWADLAECIYPAESYSAGQSPVDFQQEVVYVLPFWLRARDDDSLDELRVAFYSAALLFNLAVCYHIDGLRGKGKMIQRALNLYQMVSQLVEEPLREQPVAASLLAMVTLNNTANCHFELCDFELSKDCSARLNCLMGTLGRNHQIDENGLPRGIVDTLLVNSSLMGSHVPTAAQAA